MENWQSTVIMNKPKSNIRAYPVVMLTFEVLWQVISEISSDNISYHQFCRAEQLKGFKCQCPIFHSLYLKLFHRVAILTHPRQFLNWKNVIDWLTN